MSRKIISTLTAAAMSMSIAMVVPVAVTAVSSVAVVSQAQAGAWKNFKNSVKETGRTIAGKNCPGGGWIKNNNGFCGKAVDPKCLTGCGRIGKLRNPHDHRTR